MRYWISPLLLCCCTIAAYSQDTTNVPAEITIADECDNDEVVAGIDSKKQEKPDGTGCGCGGKPKI